jgi:hypothetical protein
MLDEARAVVERTRSQALAVARGDLLNDLARHVTERGRSTTPLHRG